MGGVFGAKQDPYIKVILDGDTTQSSYKDGAGTKAEWTDEILTVEARQTYVKRGELVLEVWNENAPAPDTLIGRAHVSAASALAKCLAPRPTTAERAEAAKKAEKADDGLKGAVAALSALAEGANDDEKSVKIVEEKAKVRARKQPTATCSHSWPSDSSPLEILNKTACSTHHAFDPSSLGRCVRDGARLREANQPCRRADRDGNRGACQSEQQGQLWYR